MKIVVNGEAREVGEGASVLTLLADARLAPEKVAIELNRRLLRSQKYGEPLKEGDEIEIVTFVGGG